MFRKDAMDENGKDEEEGWEQGEGWPGHLSVPRHKR
jgi:hypothetical protein